MADVVYRIVIEGSGTGGADSAPATTATTPSGTSVSPAPPSIYDKYKTIRNSAPVALALKYVNKAITTNISRVDLRTGRSTYQEQLQWTYSTAMKGLAIGGAIVGGIASGNYLLALGGVVSAVDTAIDYGIAERNLNLERRVENISIGMANIRAGAGGDRHGRATY